MKNSNKNTLIWVFLFVVLMLAYDMFQSGSMISSSQSKVIFSDFLTKVEDGQITDVVIQGANIEGHFSDGSKFSTYSPNFPGLVEILKQAGVKIDAMPLESKMTSLIGILLSWFPLLLLIGVWIYFMRQMQGGGSKALGFSKSKARLMTEDAKKVTFKDVAGVDEAKDDLEEIVDFLKDPKKFTKIGGRIPKGCLLIGPPGTGKTLLAKAIAGEANVPFFSISGSEFVEMFVGVGASRVRDLFMQGKEHSPCIIFIDEIDAVGRNRGIGLGGGNDEREQTLNQLLVEMDGFESNDGIIIIAATNRPDVLDPALLRPGRFDRQIIVGLPDMNGRIDILNVHLKNVKTGPDVEASAIARGTPGFSGADLRNVVNEGALLAARNDKKIVTMQDLEDAKDKIMMGAEKKSIKMTEEERSLTAYHEGGHAIVAIYQPASDPIHKATIIPRGRALGMVMRLPERDVVSFTREKLKADLAVAMAGRVAEELIFGYEKVTSGASSDIKQATRMAKSMVSEWGMSDEIGPLFHGDENQDLYLGSHRNSVANSDHTAEIIDKEVKKIVEAGYKIAHDILTKHLDQLHLLAKALLEYETLTGEEIKSIIVGKKIRTKKKKNSSSVAGIDEIKKILGNSDPTAEEGGIA